MPLDLTSLTWNEALQDYLLHLQAVRAAKTVRFYRTQLTGLVKWAEMQGLSLEHFGKRHLDAYLVSRLTQGGAQKRQVGRKAARNAPERRDKTQDQPEPAATPDSAACRASPAIKPARLPTTSPIGREVSPL